MAVLVLVGVNRLTWLRVDGCRDLRFGCAMYNKMAGQSIERLGALSDGLFAIAMTAGASLDSPGWAALHQATF
jgi:hypothetical protein